MIKRVSDKIARNFKMRIMHISDTHGLFPRLYGSFDVVLHSGDIFPNSPEGFNEKGNFVQEAAFQIKWLRENLPRIRQELQGRTLLFILGNHDFISHEMLESEFNSNGIKAISLHDKIVTYESVNFYGFPYIPYINGTFAYEKVPADMEAEVDKMIEKINQQTYVDIWVCHAPPANILDLSKSNVHFGSNSILNALNYKLSKEKHPTAVCFGHIHESHGVTIRNGILFSNAATSKNIIEI
jgi:Icc-related predicted phosphoesterase